MSVASQKELKKLQTGFLKVPESGEDVENRKNEEMNKFYGEHDV